MPTHFCESLFGAIALAVLTVLAMSMTVYKVPGTNNDSDITLEQGLTDNMDVCRQS